jgi:hypothetical protein
MQIKNKSHKQVTDVIDKVVANKISTEVAAKELGLSKHAFDELYEDIKSKMLTV